MKKKKKVMDTSYEQDTNINPDALDVEWLNQSNLYAKWAKRMRLEERRVRRAEENLKVIRSELTNKVHRRPGLLGPGIVAKGKNPTGAQVEAFYRTEPEYIEAKEELHRLMFRKDILFDAVMAMQMKKTALVELGKLALQEYFATPALPRNLKEEFQKMTERRAKKRARVYHEMKDEENDRG